MVPTTNTTLHKIIRGFGATLLYRMNDDDDQTISQLSDLKRFKKAEILNALEHGHLGAWIATFFQENPEADLSEKFAYEKLTVQFLDFIRSICPDWEPVKNYDEAIETVDANVKKASRTSGGVKVIKWIFGPGADCSFGLRNHVYSGISRASVVVSQAVDCRWLVAGNTQLPDSCRDADGSDGTVLRGLGTEFQRRPSAAKKTER